MAAQRLVHRLLENLRRNTAEVLRVNIHLDRSPRLNGVGLDQARLGQADFIVRRGHFFHDDQARNGR